MNVRHNHKSAFSGVIWSWIERLSRRLNRVARKHAAPQEIAFSADPASPSLGPNGVMQMLDAMPSWTFHPHHAHQAFATRSAASSPTTHTDVTRAELDELIGAVDRLRPGAVWLRVTGLNRDQIDEVKTHLFRGSSMTVMQ